jgi:8-oxo-dGTP diphosphatase
MFILNVEGAVYSDGKRSLKEVLKKNTLRDCFFLQTEQSSCLTMERKYLILCFFCEIETGEPFVKSPAEVEAVFWLTADEIFAHPSAIIRLKESMEEAQFLQKKIQKK